MNGDTTQIKRSVHTKEMFEDLFVSDKMKFYFSMDLSDRSINSVIKIYRVDGDIYSYTLNPLHTCDLTNIRDIDKKDKWVEVDKSTKLTNSIKDPLIFRQILLVYPPEYDENKIYRIEDDFIERLNTLSVKTSDGQKFSKTISNIFRDVLLDNE